MELDPTIWGPHYWFVLHTIALTYPLHPNDTIKKKYYDFIQNLPLFLPNKNIGKNFSETLYFFEKSISKSDFFSFGGKKYGSKLTLEAAASRRK